MWKNIKAGKTKPIPIPLSFPPDSRGWGRGGEATGLAEQGGGLPHLQLLLPPPAPQLQVSAHERGELGQSAPGRDLRLPLRPLRHPRRHRVQVRRQRGAAADHVPARARTHLHKGDHRYGYRDIFIVFMNLDIKSIAMSLYMTCLKVILYFSSFAKKKYDLHFIFCSLRTFFALFSPTPFIFTGPSSYFRNPHFFLFLHGYFSTSLFPPLLSLSLFLLVLFSVCLQVIL